MLYIQSCGPQTAAPNSLSGPVYSWTCRFVSTSSTMISQSTSKSIHPRRGLLHNTPSSSRVTWLKSHPSVLQGPQPDTSESAWTSSPSHSTSVNHHSTEPLCIVTMHIPSHHSHCHLLGATHLVSLHRHLPSPAIAKLWLDRATAQALPTHLAAVGPAVQSSWDSAPPNLLLHSTKSYF